MNIDQVFFNNTKVAYALTVFPDVVSSAPRELRINVIPNKNICTIMRLIADKDTISLSCDVTHFDICVADSIYTLFKCGYVCVTPDMIARVMDGGNNVNVDDSRYKAIEDSVDKMRRTFLKINCGDEMRHRGKSKAAISYESYLIPADKAEVRADNGRVVSGYKILQLPALYAYAEVINQIISIPAEIVRNDAVDSNGKPQRIANRDERIVLRHYVVRRIENMRNAKSKINSNRIAYAWVKNGKQKGLFADLGYREADYANWRKKRANIHKQVKEILDDLVSKGYIKGYAEYREGNSTRVTAPIAGVEVSF